MITVGIPPFASIHTDGPNQTLVHYAAKVSFEPLVTDAALCMNVRILTRGQKRDKIKVNFARGL